MNDQEMLAGRSYLMKIGTLTVGLTIAHPKYKINVNTLEHIAAKSLGLNEIGVCNLNLDRPVPFDRYVDNRDTGGFIVIDRITNNTVGCGMLHFALRRADNIHWQSIDVNKAAHAALNHQGPCIVWFTGLSGAGKSTIANLVERKLHQRGFHSYLLDGDNVRHGLNKDLGFTEADRVENIRRVAEVAALMVDAGLIVLASFISPFRSERRLARDLVSTTEFCEVFVDVTLAVAEQRDPKGLYRKARQGELLNLTGIDSPYEPPEHPEIHVDSTSLSAEQASDLVIAWLGAAGVIESA
jgi:bifunctional enzyme CysN/CysC